MTKFSPRVLHGVKQSREIKLSYSSIDILSAIVLQLYRGCTWSFTIGPTLANKYIGGMAHGSSS